MTTEINPIQSVKNKKLSYFPVLPFLFFNFLFFMASQTALVVCYLIGIVIDFENESLGRI